MDCSEMAKLSLMVSLSPEMEAGMSVPAKQVLLQIIVG